MEFSDELSGCCHSCSIRQPACGFETAYTLSFNSVAGRKAIVLPALILISSPVAGFRPIRAGRARICRTPRPVSRVLSPSFKCRVVNVTRSPSTASASFFDRSWLSARAGGDLLQRDGGLRRRLCRGSPLLRASSFSGRGVSLFRWDGDFVGWWQHGDLHGSIRGDGTLITPRGFEQPHRLDAGRPDFSRTPVNVAGPPVSHVWSGNGKRGWSLRSVPCLRSRDATGRWRAGPSVGRSAAARSRPCERGHLVSPCSPLGRPAGRFQRQASRAICQHRLAGSPAPASRLLPLCRRLRRSFHRDAKCKAFPITRSRND